MTNKEEIRSFLAKCDFKIQILKLICLRKARQLNYKLNLYWDHKSVFIFPNAVLAKYYILFKIFPA